jgi:hypothetical protein
MNEPINKREYLEYQYSRLTDLDGRSALHHLTSVEKVAQKIYNTRQCKGQQLSKLNFEYIDIDVLSDVALFHSAQQDIITTGDSYAQEYLENWVIRNPIVVRAINYFCRFSHILSDDNSNLSDPAFHYYAIVRLADIRLHADILQHDFVLNESTYSKLQDLKNEYDKLIDMLK